MLSCLYRNCEPVTKLMRILSVFNTYSALSELYDRGAGLPPVAPEVIHIKPLTWLPVVAGSSFGALSPPEQIRLVYILMP